MLQRQPSVPGQGSISDLSKEEGQLSEAEGGVGVAGDGVGVAGDSVGVAGDSVGVAGDGVGVAGDGVGVAGDGMGVVKVVELAPDVGGAGMNEAGVGGAGVESGTGDGTVGHMVLSREASVTEEVQRSPGFRFLTRPDLYKFAKVSVHVCVHVYIWVRTCGGACVCTCVMTL